MNFTYQISENKKRKTNKNVIEYFKIHTNSSKILLSPPHILSPTDSLSSSITLRNTLSPTVTVGFKIYRLYHL